MTKRTTAFVFLLVANMILLAHAVIPHHHHQAQVCVERRHCQANHTAQHITPKHHHHHEGKDSSTDCVLKQAVVLPANQIKQENDCLNSRIDSQDYPYTLFISEDAAFISGNCVAESIQNISSSYPYYINTSLGLRAPPSV